MNREWWFRITVTNCNTDESYTTNVNSDWPSGKLIAKALHKNGEGANSADGARALIKRLEEATKALQELCPGVVFEGAGPAVYHPAEYYKEAPTPEDDRLKEAAAEVVWRARRLAQAAREYAEDPGSANAYCRQTDTARLLTSAVDSYEALLPEGEG